MSNTISSRTPEGDPSRGPIRDTLICIEPSHPLGDAPCPNCGTLLWFFETAAGMRFHESKAVAPLRDKVLQAIGETLSTSFIDDLGADSLKAIELIMALEEATGVSITEEDAAQFETVGDVIDFLAKRKPLE